MYPQAQKYIAGVEGGASGSTLVLLNQHGKTLANLTGPPTNYLLIGEDECFRRLKGMVDEAKSRIHITSDTPFESIGLCLSGCLTDEEGVKFSEAFLRNYPSVAKSCTTANDLVGSVFASNCRSGVVLIAGTGSNSVIFSDNVVNGTCGGWGYLFGDEGSAYWIAWRAYKTLLDDNDNYVVSKFDTKRLREVICGHFGLENENLIGTFYQPNDKKRFASLSRELYKSTKFHRDEAIEDIFRQAGVMLARKVIALLPKADRTSIDAGLNIICVGSVFNSWDLLESGFVSLLTRHIKSFRLLKLKQSSAFGAAKLGASKVGIELPISGMTETLYACSATTNGYLANGNHRTIGNQVNGNGKSNTNGSHRQTAEGAQEVVKSYCSII